MSEVLSSPDDDFDKIVSGITPSWEKEYAIPVPPQCESCPRVMAMQDYLDSLKKSAACLVKAAMGDKVIMSIDGETIDGDEATRYLCKKAGEELDKLDEETDTIREEIVRSTDKCKGPLDLEGSDDFQAVSITACGSSEMSEPDVSYPQIGEPVEIRRLRIQRYQEGNKD
ncbi:MAG: hypothetical protein NNC22_02535 [Candidatus Nanosynbacter sp. P5B_S4_bin.39.1]|nr:hypothetical protein [Candidatus Nanosynbacter sp. P5B_S4_bin.39.1]